jgi:hypothetical protein
VFFPVNEAYLKMGIIEWKLIKVSHTKSNKICGSVYGIHGFIIQNGGESEVPDNFS